MRIFCLADNSHEMPSLVFSEKYRKKKKKKKKKKKEDIKMSSATILISTLSINVSAYLGSLQYLLMTLSSDLHCLTPMDLFTLYDKYGKEITCLNI